MAETYNDHDDISDDIKEVWGDKVWSEKNSSLCWKKRF